MIAVRQQIEEYKSINLTPINPDYDPLIDYSFGDIVFSGQYNYKSIIDDNTGLVPEDNPDSWLRWSISNRHAQVDLRATTSTEWNAEVALDPLDNALITEFYNSDYDVLAFGGVAGNNILVEIFNASDKIVFSSGEVIYNRPDSNNWYGYYFDEFSESAEQGFLFRLPVTEKGSYIRVTIEQNEEGKVLVGYMIGGNSLHMGNSLYGASLSLEDNSLIEIDNFGVTTVVKRTASNSMDIDVSIPASHIEQIKRRARSVFGDIVLWVGDETEDSEYEYLATLGYIEDFTTVLSNSVSIQASYQIKEVI